jgi:hypothetical protein
MSFGKFTRQEIIDLISGSWSPYWGGTGGTTSPGGPVNSIQFNSASLFSGSSTFTYNTKTNGLYYTGAFFISGAISASAGFYGTASWAQSSSYSFSSSYAISASYAFSSSYSVSSSYSFSSSYSLSSSYAVSSSQAASASYVNLLAGPNITINYKSNGIAISGSSGYPISFYNDNTQLTSGLTSLVISGSGFQTFVNGTQVTMSFSASGGGTGAGTVGPGKQNYISFFSGSTTQISSSTILLNFDSNNNTSDPYEYVVQRTEPYNVSESYGSNISINNDSSLHERITIPTDTIGTHSLAGIIKEIPWNFSTAWVDYHIMGSNTNTNYDEMNNDYAVMFGTIMITRLQRDSNPFGPPGRGPWQGLTFLTNVRDDSTGYDIDPLNPGPFTYNKTIYADAFGVDPTYNDGANGYLDYAWMAQDYKQPGGAGFAFQVIESAVYLPDIYTNNINYQKQLIPASIPPLPHPTNPLQTNFNIGIKPSAYWGVVFAYDIIETGISTGRYKLRIWCINATGNASGDSYARGGGRTNPIDIMVTTKTKLLYSSWD